MVYLNMVGFGGQTLVLVPTVDIYVNNDEFKHLNGRHAPSRAFWCNLTHQRASPVFPVSKDKIFSVKKYRVFKPQQPQNSSGDCVGFWVGRLWLKRGGCGYGVTIIMVYMVGIGKGGKFEVLVGGGKGERNGRQQDGIR